MGIRTRIRNGVIIDPANSEINVSKTIAIDTNGYITLADERKGQMHGEEEGVEEGQVGEMEEEGEVEVFDAEGAFVSPGFIDAHTHVMEHVTQLGVNADDYCLKNGRHTRHRLYRMATSCLCFCRA